MCPSMIRKLKVIVYFRKVFILSKFKYFCFVTILDMSLISRSCKNDHIIFNVGTPSLEARNIRIVNIITNIIEESKLISLCMVLVKSELSKEKVNGIFLSKTLNVLQSLKHIFWSTKY